MEVNADARLEPDAILLDQTHASHWHVKEIRRHLSDTVEGRFRRRVENLVAPERVQALSFVLGELGFHGTNTRAVTNSRGGAVTGRKIVTSPCGSLVVRLSFRIFFLFIISGNS